MQTELNAAVVRRVVEGDFAALRELFCSYYNELDCEDEPLHLFDEYLLPDLKAGLLDVAVAEYGGKLCGFVVFQVDDVINDWCFKEGWGDIREAYVAPALRRGGIGRRLVAFAEDALKNLGVTDFYTLPTEDSEKFFLALGYEDSGEYCPELDNKVFRRI